MKSAWLIVGFLCVSAQSMAQLGALRNAGSADSIDTIERRMGELIARPFIVEIDTVLDNLQLVLAYEKWTSLKKINFFMPIAQRVDYFTKRAQSELLMGMFKTMALHKYIPIESGVLQLMESSIAHFDSSRSHYAELNQYIVDRSVYSHQADSAFSKHMADSLRLYLGRVMKDKNYTSLEQLDVFRMMHKTAERSLRPFRNKPLDLSLAYWLYHAQRKEE